MTTAAAERMYLAQHLYAMEGKKNAIYNPLSKEVSELPRIYGFNNGGSPGWYDAIAIAEDGHVLGRHLCSDEWYMPHDLGILVGTRPDRHKNDYSKHYPDGYVMEFVPTEDLKDHKPLNEAIRLNALLKDEAEKNK